MMLSTILSRCEEVGDCWIWQQATTRTGYPIIKIGATCRLVRRVVVEASGRLLRPRQPVGSCCGDKLCVNPEHLFPSTIAAVAQKAANAGAFSSRTRGARIAQAKRRSGKITLEIARDIRASDESGPVLATRHGVHRSLITRIRSGAAWKDYASPFAGLMVESAPRKRA